MRGLIVAFFFGIIYSALGQDKKFETELDLAFYSSRPGENRSIRHDPGLMVSCSYVLHPRLFAGLGSGFISPYFSTTLAPVYIQTNYTFAKEKGIFLRGRIGEFIPMNPENYESGMYSEVALGKDFSTNGRAKFRLTGGYSYQEITMSDDQSWWGDRKTNYQYRRLLISLGWVF